MCARRVTAVSVADAAIYGVFLSPGPAVESAPVFDDALADSRPLWHLLETVVKQKRVDAISAAQARGRELVIGTPNLVARRGVSWNLTAIAAHGQPRSVELIQSLLIALAAIPAFVRDRETPIEVITALRKRLIGYPA